MGHLTRTFWATGLLLCAAAAHGSGGANVFGDAEWIFPKALAPATNTTCEFRARFASASAGPAQLAIAADTVCSVLLNGKPVVETLRFPDVPPERLYDVIAVPDVRKGENELVIRLYVQGIGSFQHIPGDPGLLFRLWGPGFGVASGEGVAWRVSAQNLAEGVPLVTEQLGFSFECRAGAAPAPWQAVVRDDCVRRAASMDLRRRPVPFAETLPPVPFRVVAEATLDGSPVPDRVAAGMDRTVRRPAKVLLADGRTADPARLPEGFSLLVDLGREECGLLHLDCETDEGTVVDVGWAEHAEDGRVRAHVGARNFAGRYVAREGRQAFTNWQRRMAGRYIELHVRGAKTRFVLHAATVKPVRLPARRRPAPEGLSPLRRRIWETAVRTLELCMHEHYEDCPWREQALYANDARNQILAGRYAFEDGGAFAALSLELLAKGLQPDGWLSMCMPMRLDFTIPSFTFSWNLAMKDYWDFTRDAAFVRRMFPTMRTILDARLGEMRDGLLPCPTGKGYWQFYDWAEGLSGDGRLPDGTLRYEAPLNLLLLSSLEADAALAEAVGEEACAARWRTRAAELRERVRGRFWNPERKCFETAVQDGAFADEPVSELVQALAILADAVPDGELPALAERLSRTSGWTETTLSQSFHKYAALLKAGETCGRRAMAQMDALWGKMLDAGATSFWEMKEGWPAFSGAGSLCHGWSAIPVYFYARYPEYFK